jgi:hypothetical protein
MGVELPDPTLTPVALFGEGGEVVPFEVGPGTGVKAIRTVPADDSPPFGWDYFSTAAQATYLVKKGPGVLHSVVFNTCLASAVVTIYDNDNKNIGGTLNLAPIIATITLPATLLDNPAVITYDLKFARGLVIVTSGANADVTVTFK